ncbi:sulfatase-like hydrolase/transferase [Pseudoduganella chitinolytica]|uniref:Sulfatase-like hydrolase/transferase n=1 Tax=Pseudoduganella chitinolytica TaxID=34070 RepID=A0ABY8BHC8_9BURK|nr:sulfatase-like hydrolase/transferase [Pseudoduganella chitinolytica]WEF35357.1 sulfatase-like hydrolase/transferase [Pseudoduganella chitinolytica]
MSKPIDNKRRAVFKGLSTLALAPLVAPLPGQAADIRDKGQPNILFILADDLGYADLSVYGNRDFKTPHLDRLAAQGVRLTQAYSNSAVCSATRFGLITGRYQYRLRGGLEEPIAGASDTIGLPPGHPTLPSLLKAAGYRTALFGKWHLGSLPNFGPLKSGYDTFFGNYGGGIDYFTHKAGSGPNARADLYEGEVAVEEVGYYTDLLGDKAAGFLRKQKKGQPFLLSLHYTAPHWPWEGPQDEEVSRQIENIFHYDGGNLATYAKMVTALDASIGRVLKTLEQQGLAENTIVVFSSDNGGERFSQTWPFTGQKTELLEGGIRVPAIVRWPARIKPNQVSQQVAISMDWLPTLLAAAGTAPAASHPSDGVNLLPVLTGAAAPAERTLFWRYKANVQKAVRAGDWKYLKLNDNEFLFNLAQDQRERANLAAKHPDKLADLKAQWDTWNAGMLPITPDVRTHGVSGKLQADRYGPQVD